MILKGRSFTRKQWTAYRNEMWEIVEPGDLVHLSATAGMGFAFAIVTEKIGDRLVAAIPIQRKNILPWFNGDVPTTITIPFDLVYTVHKT